MPNYSYGDSMPIHGMDMTAILQNYISGVNSGTITNNNKTMSLRESFVNLFKTEPEKSFKKLRITNDDGTLNSEGEDLFINFLFAQHKDKFNEEIVQPILSERKEDKK